MIPFDNANELYSSYIWDYIGIRETLEKDHFGLEYSEYGDTLCRKCNRGFCQKGFDGCFVGIVKGHKVVSHCNYYEVIE